MINIEKMKIAVIGLGYVGLPLAVEFGKKFNVIGFDIDYTRVKELHNGYDRTNELNDSELLNLNNIKITTGVECQGIFEKNYFNSESIFVSPVPFNNEINVFVGGTDRKVLLELFNANGRLLISKTFSLDENLRDINLDTSGLPQGSYILKVNGQTVSDSKLIIKE